MAADDLLDPDALAALEEERDFLLGSLRDLDREYEAGDVDDVDYRTLRDDYTHRAAVVLRAIERREAARTEADRPRRPGRVIVGVAGLVVFALLAGLGVARAAGFRTSVDGLTGDVRATVGQMLFRCNELQARFEIREALECYDEVLEDHPANVEAITNKGWSFVMADLAELAWPYFDDAVAIDPAHPDVRAFRSIVLNGWCRPEETLAELEAFDEAGPLAEMRALVYDRYQLRLQAEELLDARTGVPEVAEPPTPIGEVGPEAFDQCPALVDAGVVIESGSTQPEAPVPEE